MNKPKFTPESKTIVLIGCSATKLAETAPARSLYTGQLFKAARKYAEELGHPWYILSALHGLINPSDIVDPYNVTLNPSYPDVCNRWGDNVVSRLQCLDLPQGSQIIVLAPQSYWGWISSKLVSARPDLQVQTPLQGMGIGRQKAWLKNQLAKGVSQ